MKCQNKFWLNNPIDLLCCFTLLPLTDMDLEEQMNALTRLVILIFLILLILNVKHSYILFGISIIFIIIIYYIQRYRMLNVKERFNEPTGPKFFPSMYPGKINREVNNVFPNLKDCEAINAQITYNKRSFPNSGRFCQDNVPTGFDDDYISSNQSLAGFPNSRMNNKPIIVSPSHDLDHWKANNLVIHSHINDESVIDTYQSGYDVSTCCDYTCDKIKVPVDGTKVIYAPLLTKKVKNGKIIDGGKKYGKTEGTGIIEVGEIEEPINIKEYENTEKSGAEERLLEESFNDNHIKEDFTPYNFPYTETVHTDKGIIAAPQSGDVNTACGYNPRQLYKSNLPTNYISGNCQRNEVFKDYNKNLFTQTIQPGVYSSSEIIQPINNNIGISFQQQFEPVTCKSTDDELEYTLHDPRIIDPVVEEKTCNDYNKATYDNIFDPRQYGYGTSYRSYIDDLTGQPRFMYDDINAVRMPNYLVRSKIDFEPYADSYGPLPAGGVAGNKNNSDIRALANDSFLRNSLQQRNDLQERWMRKMDTVLAQRREAPISRSSTFTNGCK